MPTAAGPPRAGPSLTFRIGEERFTIPRAIVREVTRLPAVTRVPNGHAALLGAGNFRGSVLPVVAFASLADRAPSNPRRAILLDTKQPVALAVDDIVGLRREDEGGARPIEIEDMLARALEAGTERIARRAARIDGRKSETVSVEMPLLLFAVADQEFALPLDAVEEVLPLPADFSATTRAGSATLGTFVARTATMPLLSLPALLALPGDVAARGSRVIVARIGADRIGLAVQAVPTVVRASEKDVDLAPAALVQTSSGVRIRAIYRRDGGRRLVSILELTNLDGAHRAATSPIGPAVLSAPPGERTEPALVFTLGHAEFALPSACIVEIIRAPANLTRMPQAPALVEGLTQLRGRVVPVVNAASMLMGSDPSTAVRDMIVFRWGDREAGLLVNGISHILRVSIASHHTAATPAGANLLLSRRINLVGGKKLVILDPEEIFAHVTRALRSETHEKMAAQAS